MKYPNPMKYHGHPLNFQEQENQTSISSVRFEKRSLVRINDSKHILPKNNLKNCIYGKKWLDAIMIQISGCSWTKVTVFFRVCVKLYVLIKAIARFVLDLWDVFYPKPKFKTSSLHFLCLISHSTCWCFDFA